MKRWFVPFYFLLGILLSACTHEASSTAGSSDEIEKSCEKLSQMICTREYRPTSCMFAQQDFSGTNPCEARKLAQKFACENKIVFADEQVKCESKAPLAVANDCEAERTVCTREFKPSVCRFGDLEAKGNNRCEALNALRAVVCEKKIAFRSDEAVCEGAPGKASPRQKSRSR